MKYKVGDRVRIKSLDWYNENKDNLSFYTDSMALCFANEIVTIKSYGRYPNTYRIDEDEGDFLWTDEMIEGLVEEDVDLIPKFGEFGDNEPLDIPTMTTDFIKEHGFPCPEGYIFKDENGNVINATKIVLEKKKKEYPKTYEECAKVLLDRASVRNDFGYKGELLVALQRLLVCRDAYWKIAGEEMGLGKPWEPDYTEKTVKYCLRTNNCRIVQTRTSHDNHPFSFPTEEMRDAFKENFDPDIEFCKEFL